jgi:hypothetical protein
VKKLVLVISLLSTNLYAQEYRAIDFVAQRQTTADVREVVLLSSEVVIENLTHFQNRSVKIILGVKAVASACEDIKNIEQLSSQRSIDSVLNPTDFYFRVNTNWLPGCSTGSFGEPQFLKLELTYFIGQRSINDRDLPWPAPDFLMGENLRYLNFDIGMMGGYNRLQMYKLDYANIESPTFELTKQFSLVQGTVLDL